MTLFYVHDDLRHTVSVFYNVDDAERAITQYCRVQQIDNPPTRPQVMAAYQECLDKFESLCRKLA